MKYIDVHSHIHDKAFDSKVEIDGFNIERDLLISALKENDIYTITIGTDYETSLVAKKLAEANENIYYTIGVHPHDDMNATFDEEKFIKLLGDKCVAIGECGLDYFYIKTEHEKERQKDLFIKQINFAKENNLPLMLHGRPSEKNEIDNLDGMDAYWDMISMLSAPWGGAGGGGLSSSLTPSALRAPSRGEGLNTERKGNVHFFVGSIDIAKKFIDLGFTFSLGGVLTITREYDEMIKYLPIDSIHAETDSPYVVPRDDNGKRVSKINSPLNIEIIIEKIAEIKNISKENLNEQLLINSKSLFKI